MRVIQIVRMIGRVPRRLFWLIAMLYVVMTIGIWQGLTQPYDRYLAFRYVGANAGVRLGNGQHGTVVRGREEAPFHTTIRQVAESEALGGRTRVIAWMWVVSMTMALVAGVGLAVLVMEWRSRFTATHRKVQSPRRPDVGAREKRAQMPARPRAADALKVAGSPIGKPLETRKQEALEVAMKEVPFPVTIVTTSVGEGGHASSGNEEMALIEAEAEQSRTATALSTRHPCSRKRVENPDVRNLL